MFFSVFEEYIFYSFYYLCASVVLIDFAFDKSKQKFQYISAEKRICKHALFFIKLFFDIVLISSVFIEFSWWACYYAIFILHSLYLYYEFLTRCSHTVNFLNKLHICIRKTRKLTSVVILASVIIYLSTMWKMCTVITLFVIPVHEFGASLFTIFLCFMSFFITFPLFVRSVFVLLKLWYIWKMMKSLNEFLDNVLKKLEICKVLPWKRFEYSLESKQKLMEIISIYCEILRLLETFNRLSICDMIIIQLLAATSVIMFEWTNIFVMSGSKLIAGIFISYIWDSFFVIVWYRNIQTEFTQCRVITGKYKIKQGYEWDYEIDEFLRSMSIREISFSTHSGIIKGIFRGSFIITLVYNASCANNFKKLKI